MTHLRHDRARKKRRKIDLLLPEKEEEEEIATILRNLSSSRVSKLREIQRE
jgi:hypothetical protein